MQIILMEIFSLLIFAYPVYLVCWQGRFWFAFFATWAFLVGMSAIDPSDTPVVGLTLFGGWLLALPFCLVLKGIRFLALRLRRKSLSHPKEAAGEQLNA
jgi:hypothetical protein